MEIYEKIESTSKRLEMTDLLKDLLRNTPQKSLDTIIYLTQGKLYPDYVGVEIGVAEKLAIKAIMNVVDTDETEIKKNVKDIGDLGYAAEKILSRKTQSTLLKRPLTVEIVYDHFKKIAHSSGKGSVETKIRYLSSLLNDATPKEGKYILRTVLGRMRLGIADMTILDALALSYGGGKDSRNILERAYNLSSDLGLVAKIVSENGIKGISEFKIEIGRPIRPMLSERLTTANEILQKLEGKAALEYKYDGIRIQAHISEENIRLFSRRLENVTGQFPDVCEYLRKSISSNDVIIEGECVAYDNVTGDIKPFQEISQRRGRKYDIDKMKQEIPIKVFLFDILYLNGQNLLNQSYLHRRKKLETIINPTENVDLANQLITEDPVQIDRYMEQAVSEGSEGVIAKSLSPRSVYQAGSRGWNWIKYKRSYKAEIADTFDLVVIGAFKGKGRRAGFFGTLLMAAYDDQKDTFETVCKLGSGLTDNDLVILQKVMETSTKKYVRVDSIIESDVWVTPLLVLEVAADEITISPLHTCGRDVIKKNTGLALRFPRFTGRYRRDKSPEDATTTLEILEMYKHQLKIISS